MRLISGNSNLPLADSIAAYLATQLTDRKLERFADDEVHAKVHENVRGEDVYIIQSTSKPANDHLMELLVLVDTLRRASAARITAVIPYFGYARQDRKVGGRTPITAKLVANMLEKAGIDRLITIDLHAGQIQGFFDIPVDNLFAAPLFANHISKANPDNNLLIVSPDVGGVVRARNLAARLNCDIAIVDKRRKRAGKSEAMHVIGDVKGYNCVFVDDICDSGGTLCNAASLLKNKGAAKVSAYVTHGVLSRDAEKRIMESELDKLVITDTIAPTAKTQKCERIEVIPSGDLLAEAIRRSFNNESVSALF